MRKPYDVTEALVRVHRTFRSEKAGARRRDHANFVRKSRERIVRFPEFRRALRRKKCVYSASVRIEKYRNVALALGEVVRLFGSENVLLASRSRKNCAKIPRKNCKTSGISACRSQEKMRALGQRALHNSRNIAAALNEVGRLF